MKNFFIISFLFFSGWIFFPTSLFAATCNFSTARQCGSLGGCPVGEKCEYNIQGQYYCTTDSTCPKTNIVCGTNSTVGGCGPSAGCRYGEMCWYDIEGNDVCIQADKCPATPPDICPTNSVSDCVKTLSIESPPGSGQYQNVTVGLDVGTACSNPSLTCQHQGGPYVDNQKCICSAGSPTPSTSPTITPPTTPSTTPTPIPTLSPIESTGQTCTSLGKNTIYPPNSSCYAEAKIVQSNIEQYPLTCIPPPEANYKSTVTNIIPPTSVTVDLVSDLSEVTLGFLGPDADIISTANPDKIAQKYLFSGLFDRPLYSQEGVPREFFRTYWRMLNSRVQANLKAIFLEATNTNATKHNYYYLDSNLKSQETDTNVLFSELPSCLKKFPVCDDYADKYNKLPKLTKTKYDTLLPFDFNNARSYIALNGAISRESIPYLYAILGAIQGNNSLFASYTPNGLLIKPASLPYIKASNESTLYPAISSKDLLSSCVIPQKTTSSPAPKTYPNAPSLTQQVTIPLDSKLVSSTDDRCWCEENDPGCPYSCSYYNDDQVQCVNLGCNFSPGEKTYELTGTANGRNATVFNNPLINTLNEIIIGTGQPGEKSFYRMLTPSFAPIVEKLIISAPSTKVLTSDPNTTISNNGSSPVYRENGLAQTAMHLLQNCWLVPADQQSSSKCGSTTKKPVGECALSEEPLTGTCSKTSFSKYASGYQTGGYGAPLTTFIPFVTPELSAVYAEAEKITGVSCVILAATHFMEAGNDPCLSLISGRKIGEPEPDKGGKVYNTLLETAIDAGMELAQKGATGASYQNVITAMSNYNGGGNSNCRINWSLPQNQNISPKYLYCPPDFTGEDDPYATSLLGTKHAVMYLRCPIDHNCSFVLPFNRPGSFSVALNYYNSLP